MTDDQSGAEAATEENTADAAPSEGGELLGGEFEATETPDSGEKEAPTFNIPGEDASDEDRAAFNKALGIPDSAEGYEIPEGVEEKAGKELAGLAHTLGLSQEQLGKFHEFMANGGKEAAEQAAANEKQFIQENTSKLKEAWGADYKTNGRIAERTLAKFGSPELVANLKAGNWTKDASFIQFLHAIGDQVGEDGLSIEDFSQGENPWHPDHINLMKQKEILRKNPALARQWASEQGITLE